MVVLSFRARPIRQPVVRAEPVGRQRLWVPIDGFLRFLDRVAGADPVPDHLREDAGLPPREPPPGWVERPYHPLDPSILWRWRQ